MLSVIKLNGLYDNEISYIRQWISFQNLSMLELSNPNSKKIILVDWANL